MNLCLTFEHQKIKSNYLYLPPAYLLRTVTTYPESRVYPGLIDTCRSQMILFFKIKNRTKWANAHHTHENINFSKIIYFVLHPGPMHLPILTLNDFFSSTSLVKLASPLSAQNFVAQLVPVHMILRSLIKLIKQLCAFKKASIAAKFL